MQKTGLNGIFLGCCCMVLALPNAIAAQTLKVTPEDEVLAGDPVHIVASGLKPGEPVTLRAERWYSPLSVISKPPKLFRSEAKLQPDADGAIDLAKSSSLDGTYKGIDARGIFWSMEPIEDITAPKDVDTHEVRFNLVLANNKVLSARIRLLPGLDEVVTVKVDSLPGAVFASLPGSVARPALIILGGSEGGDSITDAAAPFASHGFAVLALPYFAPDGDVPNLPVAMVEQPVEYLDTAYRWLLRQPGVDASRIALHGTSLGATYALLGATRLDWVDAVVANVPSDVVIDGWGPGIAEGTRSAFSWRGKPLPFVPSIGYEDEVSLEEIHVRRIYERGRAAYPERAAQARIPVERFRGALMVVGSYDDQMWPSGMMAQNLAERRLEAGLEVTARIYPDAGHFLFYTGYEPTTTYHQRARKVGGSPASDARAQADVWQTTLRFLEQALQ